MDAGILLPASRVPLLAELHRIFCDGAAHHNPNSLTYLEMPASTRFLFRNFNMLTLTGQVSRYRHPNMKGCRKCRELLDLSGSEAHELSAFMSSVGSREVGTSNRRWHT